MNLLERVGGDGRQVERGWSDGDEVFMSEVLKKKKKNQKVDAGAMAQKVRALADLLKTRLQFPATTWKITTICDSSLRVYCVLF